MLRAFSSSVICGLCLALSLPGFAQEPAEAESQPAQTEPAQSEPPEPALAVPNSTEPDAAEPAQVEPNSAEPNSVEPARVESAGAEADAGQPASGELPLSTSRSVASSTSSEIPEETEEARQARIADLLTLVTDNTQDIKTRENPAYFALIKEVLRQTPEELRGKARENPRFDEFYRKPAKHRGELVHLALNVRRVLPVESIGKNEAGVTKLYELWGWTDEAKAWMYCCITPELPPGFPEKGDIAERVELTGYFFKMLAYQPGDAAPNARNLVAPLVIGRINSAPKAPAQPESVGSWPLYLIGGFGLIILLRVLMQVRAFARPGSSHRNYRRRPLEPLDANTLSDSLSSDRGLPIRNADE